MEAGSRTSSITWMIPFEVVRSVSTMVALPIVVLAAVTLRFNSSPLTVLIVEDSIASAVRPSSTTCRVKTDVSLSLFHGLRRSLRISGGTFPNAVSVGAKSVNGPFWFNVSASPAATIALVRVWNRGSADAASINVPTLAPKSLRIALPLVPQEGRGGSDAPAGFLH